MNILSKVLFTNCETWDGPVRLNCSESSTSSLNIAIQALQARRHEYTLKRLLHKPCDLGWSSTVKLLRVLFQQSNCCRASIVGEAAWIYSRKFSSQTVQLGTVQTSAVTLHRDPNQTSEYYNTSSSGKATWIFPAVWDLGWSSVVLVRRAVCGTCRCSHVSFCWGQTISRWARKTYSPLQ